MKKIKSFKRFAVFSVCALLAAAAVSFFAPTAPDYKPVSIDK